MKVSETINTLKAQRNFERTPKGRSLTEYAKNSIDAVLEDEKNWNMDVMKCLNCGFINSGLYFESGCKNCNSKDLSINA